jgi:hypothetical protein
MVSLLEGLRVGSAAIYWAALALATEDERFDPAITG